MWSITLTLQETEVGDAGLANLNGLNSLKFLNLVGTKITDAGLVHLGSMFSLERLNLSDTHITDTGLVHLKSLVRLKDLYLDQWAKNDGFPKITDAGLAHLSSLTKLESLSFHEYDGSHRNITNKGVNYLSSLTSLQELDLSGSKITDAGLLRLRGLTNLRYIDLEGTSITNFGLSAFQHSCPDCAIIGLDAILRQSGPLASSAVSGQTPAPDTPSTLKTSPVQSEPTAAPVPTKKFGFLQVLLSCLLVLGILRIIAGAVFGS